MKLSTVLAIALAALAACEADDPAPPTAPPPEGYAPLPDTARGVPIDPAIGWVAQEIRGGLHWVTNGNQQAVFLVTSQGVVLVDAPEGLEDGIAGAIRAVTALPITHVIYSHYHVDHIGGAARLAAGAAIVAQAETAAALARARDPRRPLPTQTFTDTLTLDVGGARIELSYPGPNHVPGNLIVRFPAQRTVVAIDLVWPGWVPFYELGEAEDVPGYRAAIARLLTLDFDTFVGGHVGRYGTRADVEQTRAYLDDLFAAGQRALAATPIYDVAAEVGYENAYGLVDAWLGRMADRCAAEVRAAWVGRLGGADVWPRSHCVIAIQSQRID